MTLRRFLQIVVLATIGGATANGYLAFAHHYTNSDIFLSAVGGAFMGGIGSALLVGFSLLAYHIGRWLITVPGSLWKASTQNAFYFNWAGATIILFAFVAFVASILLYVGIFGAWIGDPNVPTELHSLAIHPGIIGTEAMRALHNLAYKAGLPAYALVSLFVGSVVVLAKLYAFGLATGLGDEPYSHHINSSEGWAELRGDLGLLLLVVSQVFLLYLVWILAMEIFIAIAWVGRLFFGRTPELESRA